MEEQSDSISSAAFRPRYEVGWIPGGRLSSVSVELNAVLSFAVFVVRGRTPHCFSTVPGRLEFNGMEIHD